MSDNSLQAQIANIMGAARREPATPNRRSTRIVIAAAIVGAIVAVLATATVVDQLQQRLPISDLQLRQLQGYVCLISEAGEASPDRLWHELKLFFDVDTVRTLRRADYDRAIEWLDRRARLAIGRPEPRQSGQRFCGHLPG